jgi:hypothetical protein
MTPGGEMNSDITQPGDIVFTTIGGLRTRVDEIGGHVLGTSLHALRLNEGTFEPDAFAALLTSEQNRSLLTGSTIPRVNVAELTVPRIDHRTARKLVEALDAIGGEVGAATEIAADADRLRQSIIDAVAAGVTAVKEIKADDDG